LYCLRRIVICITITNNINNGIFKKTLDEKIEAKIVEVKKEVADVVKAVKVVAKETKDVVKTVKPRKPSKPKASK